jgi:hypothetical protein
VYLPRPCRSVLPVFQLVLFQVDSLPFPLHDTTFSSSNRPARQT